MTALKVVSLLSVAAWVLPGSTAAGGASGTHPTLLQEANARPPGADRKSDGLGKRLIRRSINDSDEDLMDAVIRSMDGSARRLEIEFDTGVQTQVLQRRIIEGLDDAIKVAAQRRRRGLRGTSSTSDKRRMPKSRQRRSDKTQSASDAKTDSAVAGASEAERAAAQRESKGGRLRELRRTWGHLPMRQREELIQGITESFLERYREWIERYYRALQETED